MFKNIKYSCILSSIFLLLSYYTSSQNIDCYTIIAGKNTTIDNSVIVGHNEDDGGPEMLVNWFKVPEKNFGQNDSITLLNGTKIPQTKKTFSYLRFQVMKQKFGDAYLNENSVLICSDACASKEDTAKGNIGYYLRKIIAEQATSARNAVKLAGKLIEKYGYESSGRTYTIADAHEVWMLSAVKGKHWIAARIPDDEIAIIPNYYTIQEVDLQDTVNFLAAPDIIKYAEKRGWYNAETDGKFNFRKAYGDSACNIADYNIPRQLAGINFLSEKQYTENDILPFSFKPKKKISGKDIENILSSHYEGTKFCRLPENKNPHQNKIRGICTQTTQYSFVAQLRSNMPAAVGALMWIAPYNGCLFPYIPVYFGIYNTNEKVRFKNYKNAENLQFENDKNNLDLFPEHSYYAFNQYIKYIEQNYPERIEESRIFKNLIEKKLSKNQKKLEKSVLELYKSHPNDTKNILTNYCNKYLDKTLIISKQIIRK